MDMEQIDVDMEINGSIWVMLEFRNKEDFFPAKKIHSDLLLSKMVFREVILFLLEKELHRTADKWNA